MTYLTEPRRNRFKLNPVGVDSSYVPQGSAKMILGGVDVLQQPAVAAGLLTPAPVARTSIETTLLMLAPPVVTSVKVYRYVGNPTVTVASPAVFTLAAHGVANDTEVYLSTTGALPTGLVAGTRYYVVSATANTFQLAPVAGGAALSTSGTQSGVHSLYALNP